MDTLSEKLKATEEDLAQRISRMKEKKERISALSRQIEKFDLPWPYKVTAANAERTLEWAKILIAFRDVKEGKRKQLGQFDEVRKVTLQTRIIWQQVNVHRAGGIGSPSSTFKSHLNRMKDDLLQFDESKRNWRLTEKAAKLLMHKEDRL